MPAKIEPRLLKGFRDYLPEDALPLRALVGKVVNVFERYGFLPVETPTLEYADLLTGKYGPEADKLMYKFEDHGGRAVALRYDHTVPLARVIAMNQNLPMPFKRYVIDPVWRADKPQAGRLREFYQCDVDIVGSEEPRADAEVLAVCYDLLRELGVKDFALLINHRALMRALLENVGASTTQHGAVLRAVDRFAKVGETGLFTDLGEAGLTQEQIRDVLTLISTKGPAVATIEQLRKTLGSLEYGAKALDELAAIVEHAQALGVPAKLLQLDLGVVRGLDYYTGLVVETVVADAPLFGSVVGGGRYDGLIGTLTGKNVPAVGASLGLGRLFDLLRHLNIAPTVTTTTQVLAASFDQESSATMEKLAATLRADGLNVEVYLGSVGKFEKQLKYADKAGIPLVIWQGPKEKEQQAFALKVLATKEQLSVAAEDLPSKLNELLK